MPRKNPAATAAEELETTGADVPVGAPELDSDPLSPYLLGDDDDDDDADDEEQDGTPEPAPAAEPAPVTDGLDVAGLLDQFAVLMAQREQQIWERLEERLATITPPATNGHAREEAPELAAPSGQYPAWMTMPNLEATPTPAAPQQPRRPRMVAFIPKTDPYNPRQTTFKTWINGREIRAKRGQVMILTAGHGIDLAKNGHGNCVDIAAMQGSLAEAAALQIPQQPDYSRPSDWDGLPMTDRSSVPIGR